MKGVTGHTYMNRNGIKHLSFKSICSTIYLFNTVSNVHIIRMKNIIVFHAIYIKRYMFNFFKLSILRVNGSDSNENKFNVKWKPWLNYKIIIYLSIKRKGIEYKIKNK